MGESYYSLEDDDQLASNPSHAESEQTSQSRSDSTTPPRHRKRVHLDSVDSSAQTTQGDDLPFPPSAAPSVHEHEIDVDHPLPSFLDDTIFGASLQQQLEAARAEHASEQQDGWGFVGQEAAEVQHSQRDPRGRGILPFGGFIHESRGVAMKEEGMS